MTRNNNYNENIERAKRKRETRQSKAKSNIETMDAKVSREMEMCQRSMEERRHTMMHLTNESRPVQYCSTCSNA